MFDPDIDLRYDAVLIRLIGAKKPAMERTDRFGERGELAREDIGLAFEGRSSERKLDRVLLAESTTNSVGIRAEILVDKCGGGRKRGGGADEGLGGGRVGWGRELDRVFLGGMVLEAGGDDNVGGLLARKRRGQGHGVAGRRQRCVCEVATADDGDDPRSGDGGLFPGCSHA